MPDRTFGEDLRVSYPPTLDVREAPRTRNRSVTPTSVDVGVIEDLLQGGGFDLVKPLAVRPKRARGPLATGDADSEKLNIELKVRGDEQAVVLMDRGGYWSWHSPSRKDRALGDGSATFELDVRPPAGAPATRGLADEIRTFVLKFSAPFIAGTAIKVLEVGVDEGIVHITSTDPKLMAAGEVIIRRRTTRQSKDPVVRSWHILLDGGRIRFPDNG